MTMYKDKTELKGMINSVYGICVTDVCKDENIYDGEGIHNSRRNLFGGILEFQDNYVYTDTDSIKELNQDLRRSEIRDT